jgi:hypothetical protein
MTTFKELNENLNEYYLIQECIKYSGKINIELEKEYDRLIKKYKNFQNYRLYINSELSIDFIREYQDKFNWLVILTYLIVYGLNNIEFIREFKDKLDWEKISKKLKELNFYKIDFIREFQDKLDWYWIRRYLEKDNFNNLEFRREFKDKLN